MQVVPVIELALHQLILCVCVCNVNHVKTCKAYLFVCMDYLKTQADFMKKEHEGTELCSFPSSDEAVIHTSICCLIPVWSDEAPVRCIVCLESSDLMLLTKKQKTWCMLYMLHIPHILDILDILYILDVLIVYKVTTYCTNYTYCTYCAICTYCTAL